MSDPVNILVMIHGMIPKPAPDSQEPQYEEFWKSLLRAKPALENRIQRRIHVQWGHELPETSGPLRDDEKLTRAQQYLYERVAFRYVRRDLNGNNRVIHERGIPFVRKIFTELRERTLIRGVGDVVYYCSKEGEAQIRKEVYRQVLSDLEEHSDGPDVRLHFFGHSLGATLSHDFLYGLFAPDHEPDFIGEEQGATEDQEQYAKWREKAQNGQLRLGSLACAASQLPLFMIRKQALVDRLAQSETLDPAVIGIDDRNSIQWKTFYDVDDILAFATRRLYRPNRAIMDIQVDTGDTPGNAHENYWTNTTVIEETAELMGKNAS